MATRARSATTYVYCLLAAARRPSLARVSAGLPGLGAVRLLDVGKGEWLAVADVPPGRYTEDEINSRLSDLDWVARAAVAHESVIAAFITAPAILPMKLFTIFGSDDRALDHIRADRRRVDRLLDRVRDHHEWGVRVVVDRNRAAAPKRPPARSHSTSSGASYLALKRAQRDSLAELRDHAAQTVSDLYDRLASIAQLAKRKLARELPVQGGPLLLDAALLVARSRTARLRTTVQREARRLAPRGYIVTMTGPWPPYSFIGD